MLFQPQKEKRNYGSGTDKVYDFNNVCGYCFLHILNCGQIFITEEWHEVLIHLFMAASAMFTGKGLLFY
jgi:hypothetical protein